tara:strand:- start:3788 stop:4009 length:222 start_codon:yes stop_codon:yes gene_type:complete
MVKFIITDRLSKKNKKKSPVIAKYVKKSGARYGLRQETPRSSFPFKTIGGFKTKAEAKKKAKKLNSKAKFSFK